MMKYHVTKTDLSGMLMEDFGYIDLKKVKELALSYIPAIFANETIVNKAINVIKKEGADDWCAPGPAMIHVRREEVKE